MNRFTIAAALATSIGACSAEDLDSSLTIENKSSFTFVEINLSPTDHVDFGTDLLGADTLQPGESLELSAIACGLYDIRVIDETNSQCILDSVDLCIDNAVWKIDDAELVACSF